MPTVAPAAASRTPAHTRHSVNPASPGARIKAARTARLGMPAKAEAIQRAVCRIPAAAFCCSSATSAAAVLAAVVSDAAAVAAASGTFGHVYANRIGRITFHAQKAKQLRKKGRENLSLDARP